LLTLQKEEVMDSAWVSLKGLEEFSKNHAYDLSSLSHTTTIEIAIKLGLV
jgi:hypothetical protein